MTKRKVCTSCGKSRVTTEFYKRADRPSRMSCCKRCHNAATARNRKARKGA